MLTFCSRLKDILEWFWSYYKTYYYWETINPIYIFEYETSESESEWGFYAPSAFKAIFRARTYNCITYSVSPVMMITTETKAGIEFSVLPRMPDLKPESQIL